MLHKQLAKMKAKSERRDVSLKMRSIPRRKLSAKRKPKILKIFVKVLD